MTRRGPSNREFRRPHPQDRPRLREPWVFENPAAAAFRARFKRVVAWSAGIAALALAGWAGVEAGADDRAQRRAYRAAVEADLIRLRDRQEAFRAANGRYATLEELGIDFISSQGVRVRVHTADGEGWSATAWHLKRSGMCSISVGSGTATPADPPAGQPVCR